MLAEGEKGEKQRSGGYQRERIKEYKGTVGDAKRENALFEERRSYTIFGSLFAVIE